MSRGRSPLVCAWGRRYRRRVIRPYHATTPIGHEIIALKPQAFRLANAIGPSNEHPDFTEEDWRTAVANGETREGYWDWVISEMRYQNHVWLDGHEQ